MEKPSTQPLSTPPQNNPQHTPETLQTHMESISNHSESALQGIAKHIYTTPLHNSTALQHPYTHNTKVYLKLESEQVTGSFKARGAAFKVKKCSESGINNITTASTGNHALATIHALRSFGIGGTIFLPETASKGKLEKINRSIGEHNQIRTMIYGKECMEAEVKARNEAEKDESISFISPYNDLDVIIGQSTIGVEIFQQLNNTTPDVIYISVGGGGLISGVAAYLKKKALEQNKSITIIGCQPQQDHAMYQCLQSQKIIEAECLPTLSDGTAGNVESGAVTFDLCSLFVDKWMLMSEESIKDAMKFVLDNDSKLIEGAAAVAVAAFIAAPEELKKDKTSVVVICGGNVASSTLLKILS